ncbi:MAG: pyridoxal-phosphate dependent enzyme [Bryobacterales bacterium]|nr:pyridoxal-phosphate dependent enzyme [Bryobacterales bacterium]
MELAVLSHDIEQASERIRPLARWTPVLESDRLNERASAGLFFKAEGLQRGGSFKLRGAANFVRQIPRQDLAAGVVAFSSGNHAQAVAIAARDVGARATIVMPSDAPKVKLEGTQSWGADVIFYDRLKEDREAVARKVLAERGGTLIPPFDHPWIIAGQGTCALELMQQAPGLDALLVCLGGGGLLAGCAIAAKTANPAIRVFGVEPLAGNDVQQSLRSGKRVAIPVPDTIADGLRTTCVGAHNFPILQALVEDVLTVSEEEIAECARLLMKELRVVVEPSGAVAAAAALFGKLPGGMKRVGITLSGGNAEADFLRGLLA